MEKRRFTDAEIGKLMTSTLEIEEVYERFAEDGAGEDLRGARGSEATTDRRSDA